MNLQKPLVYRLNCLMRARSLMKIAMKKMKKKK